MRSRTQKEQDKMLEKGIGVKVDASKQVHIPQSKLRAGNVSKKIPIVINSKTVVCVNPGCNEQEVKARWDKIINRKPK